MKEFEIIDKYFNQLGANTKEDGKDILVDIGDDCAVLDISRYKNLVVTTDTLVSGTHFLDGAPAASIGHKAIAVSLSDIAAMGCIPKWGFVNITLPSSHNSVSQAWLQDFTRAIDNIAKLYKIKIIGGDTTSATNYNKSKYNNIISITVTILGINNQDKKILTRSGAEDADGIFVTGDLGGPAYILDNNKNSEKSDYINNINKLNYPNPRVNEGLYISQYANSAIDISDGLVADLNHILSNSNKSAELFLDNLPAHDLLDNNFKIDNSDKYYKYILTGGDEYELLFTAPLRYKKDFEEYSKNNNVKITYIGNIIENNKKNSNNSKIIYKNNNIDNNLIKDKLIEQIDNNPGWEHFS